MSTWHWIGSLLLWSSLVACGGGGGGTPPATAPLTPDPAPPASTALPDRLTISGPTQVEAGTTSTWRIDGLAAGADLVYDWQFGGLGQARTADGVFRFEPPGSYEVRVVVANGAGRSVAGSLVVQVRRQAMVAGLDCAGGPGRGWCRQAPVVPGTIDVAVDGDRGVAVGELGLVQLSADGGRSWQRQVPPTAEDLMSVRLTRGGQAWAIARSGALWRSLDGGRQWQRAGQLPVPRAEMSPRDAWWAVDDRRLAVSGVVAAAVPTTVIHVSEDGGASWRASGFANLLGVTPGGTMVGSTGSGLYATRDFGRSMTPLLACPGSPACLGSASDSLADDAALVVLARTADSTLERTRVQRLTSRDGGSTWSTLECAWPRFLNSVVLFPGRTSYAWTLDAVATTGGRSTYRWRSSDDGCTWEAAPAADSRYESARERPLDADTLLQTQGSERWLSVDQGRTWRALSLPGVAGATPASLQRYGRSGLVVAVERPSQPSNVAWFTSSDDGLGWQPLPGGAAASPGVEDPAIGLWFTDARHGVQAGARGQVRVTDDGGIGWTVQPAPSGVATNPGSLPLEARGSLVFTSDRVAWLWAPGLPMARRSTDAGATWEIVPIAVGSRAVSMQAVGDRRYWVLAEECRLGGDESSPCDRGLYTSDDAGQTPLRRVAGVPPLADVTMADERHGVMVTATGELRTSADGGLSWTPARSGSLPAGSAASIHFRTPTDVWLLGRTLLHSTDGGLNWTPSVLPAGTPEMLGLHFVDADRGWLVGRAGTVLSSTDGGRSWARQDSGTTRDLSRVYAIDADTAWVAGPDGTALASVTGGR